MRQLIAIVALLAMSGCTTAPGGDRIAQKDPLEGYNRFMYGVNRGVDHAIIRPVAKGYVAAVPESGRRGLTNVLNNVDEPKSFVNAVLQGKPRAALRTLARFIINTTLGVGGLADHASWMGIRRQDEDFGQTFAVWGIGSGPYLVLPLLGPSTLRDTAGRVVEFVGGDPYRFALDRANLRWYYSYGITGVEILDLRAQVLGPLDALTRGSADEYATVRSAYLQSRRNEIYDGTPPDEDFEDVPITPAEAAAVAAPSIGTDASAPPPPPPPPQ